MPTVEYTEPLKQRYISGVSPVGNCIDHLNEAAQHFFVGRQHFEPIETSSKPAARQDPKRIFNRQSLEQMHVQSAARKAQLVEEQHVQACSVTLPLTSLSQHLPLLSDAMRQELVCVCVTRGNQQVILEN
eukprot:TRINITY_DN10249_c0_g1_i1.p2 TRINITY_DN10249_c0_g1~~TRINITY_DN10249_c0_g1_i1.p2  ORF type:complete len:130 (+),score=14.85 TRINITY_DN10249_c0_g1_i1:758-1147(+)